jgi:hypothetical protein
MANPLCAFLKTTSVSTLPTSRFSVAVVEQHDLKKTFHMMVENAPLLGVPVVKQGAFCGFIEMRDMVHLFL